MTRFCNVSGCCNKVLARNLCNKHYIRMRKFGDPLAGKDRFSSPEVRFEFSTEISGECLLWTGAKNSKGYPQLKSEGRIISAHRYAWEREKGQIPDGMEIDHICRNRACVNVNHLRLATRSQNMQNLSLAGRAESGVRGVYKDGNMWRATLFNCGEVVWQKWFKNLSDAEKEIIAARKRVHTHAPTEAYT
ncbi:HNH endonuclease [Enterobacter hormaechei]|uniref:HNH endonuclease signature motif containing protein n=1 Tax=Enterobacter hormaechei TaxID=158836 RepID=UPI00067B9F9F|nr:HNH endonuclease signature motif containing protein [Enterobacter hormaechei]EHK3197050.1 HNH endonuclease [Enterobacter hormaechei]ELD3448370.1 HNH endonuclease [Enterobacter hormaechei]MDA4660873.1 HNH endonuclease [Enterobacter hormaechei]MEA8905518.1 HNH endonuclease signature motif containing protein [Enterobacter hormaechei]SAD07869.1 HNH endonuclease [Enterobacter hormaechei]